VEAQGGASTHIKHQAAPPRTDAGAVGDVGLCREAAGGATSSGA